MMRLRRRLARAARTPLSSSPELGIPGARVCVVGVTGSGKSTLARALSTRLALPYIELDSLHWEPDWREVPDPVFRERVADATAGESWVTDGNYSAVRDLLWGRADTLVWLDYPLPLVLWRLLRRTTRRVVTREELWAGNRERLTSQFTRDSLFLWALKSYPKHKQLYPQLLADSRHAHLASFRFRSPRQTARWLATLPVTPHPSR